MTEHEVLYNFGVLTKRYELVSRTAGQLAPGVAGAAIGFVMILAGCSAAPAFAPVLVGFWFALGKVPFGRHRGVRVRTVVGPLARYGMLRLGGKAPVGDARHVAERGRRPGRHRNLCATEARSPPPSSRRRRRKSSRPAKRPRKWRSGRRGFASSCPRSWAGCAGWRCTCGRCRSRTPVRADRAPEHSDRGDLGVGRRPVRRSPDPTNRPPRSSSGARCSRPWRRGPGTSPAPVGRAGHAATRRPSRGLVRRGDARRVRRGMGGLPVAAGAPSARLRSTTTSIWVPRWRPSGTPRLTRCRGTTAELAQLCEHLTLHRAATKAAFPPRHRGRASPVGRPDRSRTLGAVG